MSEASQLFWQAMGRRVILPGDEEALRLLRQAAAAWRSAEQHFNAGLAMTMAIAAAWGSAGGVRACAEEALQDFQRSEATAPPCSPESLLALYHRALHLHRYTPDCSPQALWEEVAYRLYTYYSDSLDAASYMVRGFIFKSNLEAEWEPEFPLWEVQAGQGTTGDGVVRITFPSAFHVFVWLTDYQAANEIAERFPEPFSTPGLRGWKAAVRGFVAHREAPERFHEAAGAFAEDVRPADSELFRRGGWWSSRNIDLWAKYFTARAALASTVREPRRVPELVRTAAQALEGTDSGHVDQGVSTFRVLVQTLSQLLSEDPASSTPVADIQFLTDERFPGHSSPDEVTRRFLSLLSQSLQGFRLDPAREMVSGKLPAAIDTLARIPLIGPDIPGALSPAIGAKALAAALGPDHSWIHRTLENITDEGVLRKLLLRLLQAAPSPPAYAHIRHGPVEYGKDLAVLLEQDGQTILRMYQVKCGDLTLPGWRQARCQLEEMFQAEMPSLQLPAPPDRREGILICNRHAQPQVEPPMQGWFDEQLRDHGRSFQFMHVDKIVTWLHSQRLYSAFRQACSELGIST